MIGKKLAHYEIMSLLGVGGKGEVYRAHDALLRRDVALKVLRANSRVIRIVCTDSNERRVCWPP